MSTVIYKHIKMFETGCSQFYVACDVSYDSQSSFLIFQELWSIYTQEYHAPILGGARIVQTLYVREVKHVRNKGLLYQHCGNSVKSVEEH